MELHPSDCSSYWKADLELEARWDDLLECLAVVGCSFMSFVMFVMFVSTPVSTVESSYVVFKDKDAVWSVEGAAARRPLVWFVVLTKRSAIAR